MSTGVLDPAQPVRHRMRAAILGLAAIAAVVFVALAALPYFLSSSYGPPEYAPRRGWLLLHIAGGMVALLTGPVQLWLGLADRGMEWHRRMGTAYVTSVGISALAAFYLAFNTDFGWVFGAGLTGLAMAWISTTALAVLAIRRALVAQHREWMIRSYVVTFSFVVFRLVFPLLEANGIGTIQERLAAAAWIAWTIPLLGTELVLQGRKILAVKAI